MSRSTTVRTARTIALLTALPLVAAGACAPRPAGTAGAAAAGTQDPGAPGSTAVVAPGTAAGTTRPARELARYAPGPDVREFHGDPARSGQATAAPLGRPFRAWTTRLDGAVYAQPLLLTVARRRMLVVATEANSLYGLDPRTGAVRWHSRRIGQPVPGSRLPCGNIDPLGITGTPVFDPRGGAVWAVAEILGTGGHVHHVLVAVDPATGRIRLQRPVDPAGQDPRVEQQRGALLAADGSIYVAYGGLSGDCGAYHGYIVGSERRTGRLTVYRVPSTRMAGIWAPAGPVGDRAGHLYVAVGNGAATHGRWDHSDSVLELSAALKLVGAFAPRQWAVDNAADGDLGSAAPTLMGHGVLYADGKSPYAYALRAGHLRGVGTQLSRSTVCASYGATAWRRDTVFVPCADGLRAVTVTAAGRMRVAWRAASSISGSPVVSGRYLFALDRDHGTFDVLDATRGRVLSAVPIGAASRFATPAVSGAQAFIGTMSGVVAVDGV